MGIRDEAPQLDGADALKYGRIRKNVAEQGRTRRRMERCLNLMDACESRKIVVVGPLSREDQAKVRSAGGGAQVVFAATGAEAASEIGSADALVTMPRELSEDLLDRAGKLKWIHLFSAGIDEAMNPSAMASSAVLTCAKGNGAVALAEHSMMLMLMLNRQALLWIEAQRESAWIRFQHGELAGLTLGIVGLGKSGVDLARKAKAFHMRVIGLHRSDGAVAGIDEVVDRASLHRLLSESDFVVVGAPLTSETRGMFGEAEFRAMKNSAFPVCYSRGGIADDAALLRALDEGWIAGAGLDAHGQEPLPSDSPFWRARNTIITPHAGSSTSATWARGIDILTDNLRRFVRGDELLNKADKRLGY